MSKRQKNKIWVDLDNSPHVPFFKPIVEELERRGFTVVITARECSQTCGLADLLGLRYKKIGRHHGKNKVVKLTGLILRAFELMPTALKERPSLAVSHGSRAQLIACAILRIPSVVIADYEYAKVLPFARPDCFIMPDVLPEKELGSNGSGVYRYHGIKEDVYVPCFKPDPSIEALLGLNGDDIVATVRPPASEAHYHNPESDRLFTEAVEFLASLENVRIVMLPRYDRQAALIRSQWPDMCANGKIVIPHVVVDGLNLIWYSDFVISGGGTMNREAAALGVPVYSIFRGKIGAVDRYLASVGRLTLLETIEDVRSKIRPVRRPKSQETSIGERSALTDIVAAIEKIARTAGSA